MIWTEQFQSEFVAAKRKAWRADPKLMIVLHGRGDSLDPFLHLPKEMRLPEMNYLFLNAPRKCDTGYSWYGLEPNHARGILRSRTKLHTLMEELAFQGWRSEDIFLFGLSQGCLMAGDLLMSYDRAFAGFLGISGYVWFFPKWSSQVNPLARKTPCIMTHGFDDKDIPIDETRAQVKKMQKNGFGIEWLEMNKGHEVETQFEAPLLGQWVRNQVERRLAHQARHHRKSMRISVRGFNPAVNL